MRCLLQRLGLLLLGSMLVLAAHGQPPGGGFGGDGGFGGGGGRGGGGRGGGEPQPEQQEERDILELLPGRWYIEFRIEYFSEAPEAYGRYLEVYADMYVTGDLVEGRIREIDIRGTFSCQFDGTRRCQNGTMRFDGEDQDWPDFGFEIEPFADRATGWAEWIDADTGEIQRFELRMRKR